MRIWSSIAVVAFSFAACAASLPIERREYILSRPHGWIELTVEDSAIPLVPFSDEDPKLVRPSSCYLSVLLDREPFVEGQLYPDGETEPFRVRSGFRFPVPVGTVAISGEYSGCDVGENGKLETWSYETTVPVSDSMVTELEWDGRRISVGATRPDTAGTLERIYEAVSGAGSSR
jgi:hypothetical protein